MVLDSLNSLQPSSTYKPLIPATLGVLGVVGSLHEVHVRIAILALFWENLF